MENNKKGWILNYLNMEEFKYSFIFKIIFILFCILFVVFFMKVFMYGKFNLVLLGVEIFLGVMIGVYIKNHGRKK